VARGKSVLLVQDGPIGGDCTFTGCVPSKSMIAAAARGESFADAMAGVRKAIAEVAATETADVFRKEGIDVIEGRARFTSPSEIRVGSESHSAKRVVIATGARPMVPPVPGLSDIEVLTSENVFDLQSRPLSLGVLGGGPIGCELAQAFARLGVEVTLIEGGSRLLPREEPEASEVVAEALTADGVDLRLGAKLVAATRRPTRGAAKLELAGGQTVNVDRVLVAAGRRAITDGLGLREAGVEKDERGFVRTDDGLRTTARGIYAVGDVAGKLQLTHAADHMARIAVGNAFSRGRRRTFRPELVPWVTFTDPEVARVGWSEAEAAGRKGSRVGWVPMAEVDRAIAEGDTRGFVKMVFGPRRLTRNLAGGRVAGATIVAKGAGELIHEPSLAVTTGMFAARLALAVHAYPTRATAVRKAVGQLFLEIDGRRARPAEENRFGSRPAGE
jgi:pyruvate/2-oxoglutarate dehydrogenase complex dihydrolipoamide dehydrogenase (E3) component